MTPAPIHCENCESQNLTMSDDRDELICEDCGHRMDRENRVNYKSPVQDESGDNRQ